MADNITLKTWLGETVTAMHDAIIRDTMVQKSGILKGCDVTYASGNALYISSGYGMIKGRLFELYETEVKIALPASGTLRGRLYLHMDLSNTDEPIAIRTYTGQTLPTLTQDENCNYDNGIYEIELATFTAGTVALSNVSDTGERLENVVSALMESMDEKADKPTILSATLNTGNTALTFTNAAIRQAKRAMPFTDDWEVSPTAISRSGNTVTLTFDAQDHDVAVDLYVYSY